MIDDKVVQAIAKRAYEQRIRSAKTAPTWELAGTLVQAIWVESARASVAAMLVVLDEQIHQPNTVTNSPCECERCGVIVQIKALFEDTPHEEPSPD